MNTADAIKMLKAIEAGKTPSFNFRLHGLISQVGPGQLREWLEELETSIAPEYEQEVTL